MLTCVAKHWAEYIFSGCFNRGQAVSIWSLLLLFLLRLVALFFHKFSYSWFNKMLLHHKTVTIHNDKLVSIVRHLVRLSTLTSSKTTYYHHHQPPPSSVVRQFNCITKNPETNNEQLLSLAVCVKWIRRRDFIDSLTMYFIIIFFYS